MIFLCCLLSVLDSALQFDCSLVISELQKNNILFITCSAVILADSRWDDGRLQGAERHPHQQGCHASQDETVIVKNVHFSWQSQFLWQICPYA